MKREIDKILHSIVYRNKLDQIHQEGDKPSIVYFHGHISFDKNYKRHRKGKPVIINRDGILEYWENDHFVKSVKI